jgi:hypothetical protein
MKAALVVRWRGALRRWRALVLAAGANAST